MPVVDDAHAYFITWTTYGTWLPGDPRGHVSNVVGSDERYHLKSNQFGTNSPRAIEQRSTVLAVSRRAVPSG